MPRVLRVGLLVDDGGLLHHVVGGRLNLLRCGHVFIVVFRLLDVFDVLLRLERLSLRRRRRRGR